MLVDSVDDFLGHRFEEAFRQHLRRRAAAGEFGDIVAVGPFWAGGDDQIDAVALAGRSRAAVLVGEAKWARSVDARPLEVALIRKSAALPNVQNPLRIAVAARGEVRGAAATSLVITAGDIFGEPAMEHPPLAGAGTKPRRGRRRR